MTPANGPIDAHKYAAHVLSVRADKANAAGNMAEASRLLQEAASLDATYEIRAETVGQADQRRIQVANTIKRQLIPALVAAGFTTTPGTKPSDGCLTRTIGDSIHSLMISRSKFGGGLGFQVSRTSPGGKTEYYDWHRLGNRTGTLAYRTQAELEAACVRWGQLFTHQIEAWLRERSH